MFNNKQLIIFIIILLPIIYIIFFKKTTQSGGSIHNNSSSHNIISSHNNSSSSSSIANQKPAEYPYIAMLSLDNMVDGLEKTYQCTNKKEINKQCLGDNGMYFYYYTIRNNHPYQQLLKKRTALNKPMTKDDIQSFLKTL
jgi:hypothetical protein